MHLFLVSLPKLSQLYPKHIILYLQFLDQLSLVRGIAIRPTSIPKSCQHFHLHFLQIFFSLLAFFHLESEKFYMLL